MSSPIGATRSVPPASAVRMYAAVIGVGVACALAIVTVYETTRPVIQRNRVNFRQRAILDVLPAAHSSAAFRRDDSGDFVPADANEESSELIFAGYDAQGRLIGLAIEAQGVGYQDVVRVLYGYSFESQAIVGIRVLESRETPGLGDRIETDEDFLDNFERLDVAMNDAGDAVAHPIEFVKPGEKTNAWQIDGISGATITSQATAEMLRRSSTEWIPKVRRRRSDFLLREQAETATARSPEDSRRETDTPVRETDQ